LCGKIYSVSFPILSPFIKILLIANTIKKHWHSTHILGFEKRLKKKILLLREGENQQKPCLGLASLNQACQIGRRILSVSNEMEVIHLVGFKLYFCPNKK
jgi:hypothetical protein